MLPQPPANGVNVGYGVTGPQLRTSQLKRRCAGVENRAINGVEDSSFHLLGDRFNPNRLLSRTPDAIFGAAPVTFTYTPTGQRETMTDASGMTTYTYTDRDQVATKQTPQGTLTYTYNPGGVVLTTLSSANGTDVAYAYDGNNRLASVIDNRTGGTTTYNYDATNQVDFFTYANGVKHDFAYDDRDRITDLDLTLANSPLASYSLNYSDSGRIDDVAENSGRNTGYTYDSIYRLIGENITGDPDTAGNGALNYALDLVGNRSSLTSTLTALPSQSFSYNFNDQPTVDSFDDNGNTVTSGGHTFLYDYEDRLTQFDATVGMQYDGDGNRVSRTENGTEVRYLVDEMNPTGWPQVAEEVVGGNVVAQYTHGLMRISQNRDSGSGFVTSYYGYDAGGSVRKLFDAAGVETDTYTYDAFGNVIAQTGSTENLYLYRGEQFDPSLGMYYLRARYYIPSTGRFLTMDKFEGVARAPITTNKYVYGNAEPAGVEDPGGHLGRTVQTGLVLGSLDVAATVAITTSAVCAVVKAVTYAAISNGTPIPLVGPPFDECQPTECERIYPNLVPIEQLYGGYPYYSEYEAFDELRAQHFPDTLQKTTRAPARSGPCGIETQYITGEHVNVRNVTRNEYAGSLVKCDCCDESSGVATPTVRWGIR